MNYLKLLNLTKSQPKGFSLLEIIFTTVLVGVIAALGIPSLQKTIELQTLKSAASQIYEAVAQAQAKASQRNEYWQFSLRTNNNVLQYAVHQVSLDPFVNSTSMQWTTLPSQIAIDANNTNMNTINSIYQVCFTDQGLPSTVVAGTPQTCTIPANFSPAQISLKDINVPNAPYRRCIVISTLLGAFNVGEDQSHTQNGFTCY